MLLVVVLGVELKDPDSHLLDVLHLDEQLHLLPVLKELLVELTDRNQLLTVQALKFLLTKNIVGDGFTGVELRGEEELRQVRDI